MYNYTKDNCKPTRSENGHNVDLFRICIFTFSQGGDTVVKKIMFNQLGYIYNMQKLAYFTGYADSFQIVRSHGGVAFSGTPEHTVYDEASGDNVSLIDFSELRECGEFYIRIGIRRSHIFSISPAPYHELKLSLLKGLYYSRCSALDRRFAGEYSRGECHSGLVPLFENRSVKIDVSGGWHDSGGYGKYSVCTCVALGHLLYAYSLFPERFSDSSDIPESGNGIPDILNECRVGLEWLMKMQTRDGGVYHKVAPMTATPIVMPENDHTEKYVFPRSHQAATCFCAVTSLASRVFADLDGDFAARLNEASINAWIWLMNNPEYKPFVNPPTTTISAAGDFFDNNNDDDMFWAVCELYQTTGDETFHNMIKELCGKTGITGFLNRDNGGFGALSYLFGKRPKDELAEQTMRAKFRIRADNLYALSRHSGYGTAKSEDDYTRGSNMYSMTDSMLLIAAYKLFGCECYLDTAYEQLGYVLGKNPMGLCFVTGMGSDSVKRPHHRPSEADDIDEPVPGLLVCGPNKRSQDKFTQWNIPSEEFPAKCYYDIVYSFSTNEATIYCNSAAVFVAAYFDGQIH